jgi:hypothetical protein
MAIVKLPEEDYPSNANSDVPVKKEIARVTTGEVRAKKKGFLYRVKTILFADDIENVKEYAITDVIIPGLKNLIVDSVAMLVQGSAYSSRRRDRDDRVSYATKYRYGDREERRDRKRRDDKEEAEYDDIFFRSRADAEAVLDGMYDRLKEYDYVSLKDFYDLAGYKSNVFDDNWGWDELKGIEVRRSRDGYYLTLSKPQSLK